MTESLVACCHCGEVRIAIPALPETVTECNCSVCHRYGARWAYFTRDRVELLSGADRIAPYSWGDRTIEFFHCTRCGCLTHYESVERQEHSRVGINTRMLPPETLEGIAVRHFDGADSWQYLD